ncbi:MAG: glycosyltransferase, partial [Akkermansiaceae bacterium]|nr:glycosyltransferase [Akkermansiaceae bacterium]
MSWRRSLGYWRTKKHTAMMRVLRGHIDQYVTNSDPVKEEIVSHDGVPADRITVIPNGIDLGLFRPDGKGSRAAKRREWGFGEDDLVIGGVSTLRPVKKVET